MKFSDQGIPILNLPGKLAALRSCIEDHPEDALGHLFDLMYFVAPGYKLFDAEGINELCDRYGRTPTPILSAENEDVIKSPKMTAKLLSAAMVLGDEDPLTFEDWVDWESAAFELGVRLGLWPDNDEDNLSFSVRFKHFLCSNNQLSELLGGTLDELVSLGFLDMREEPDFEFRSSDRHKSMKCVVCGEDECDHPRGE